ncbi:hypothetical protein SVIOM74S_07905 [Streptomyces violarus]
MDRPAPGGGAGRAAGQRRRREFGAADLDPHPLQRHAEGVGADLREHCPGPRTDVRGVDPHQERAVGQCAGRRRGGRHHDGIRRRGHARAQQQGPFPVGARPGIAPGPAEAAGALAQTLHQVPAAERLAAVGFDVRFVADAQFDRVHAQFVGEFVHGGLQRVHARRLARRPHPRRRGHVQRRDPVLRTAVGRRVHHPRRDRRLLHELLDPGSVRRDLVHEGGEASVASAPSRSRCRVGARCPTTAGKYRRGSATVTARPVCAHRHRGEHHVRPRRALGTEAAAHVFGGDDDPLLGNAEQPGEHAPHGTGALAGGVHGEPAVVPAGGAGVRLHGMVVQRRHAVGDIDPGSRGTEGPVGVAPFADGRIFGVGVVGDVHTRVGEVREGHVGVPRRRHRRDGGGTSRAASRVSATTWPRTAAVRRDRGRAGGIVRLGEPRRVVVGEDGEHTGDGQGGRRVDAGHPAGRQPPAPARPGPGRRSGTRRRSGRRR